MRLVSTELLKPEMVLAKSIYYRECLILRAGQTNLVRYVENLHNMGIEYIYVEDAKSEGIEIPDVISEDTRIKCKAVVRRTMLRLIDENVFDVSEMRETISAVVDEVLRNEEVQVSLNDISSTDDYTFTHSVNTTVYSILLASRLNYSRATMEKLAIGTLLHDIGKVLLDRSIVFKDSALTQGEFEYVKKHTELGYEALRKCVSITELSRRVSLEHHERMDGTGYPRGIRASELHEFARIVAITDVYDALTTDRCYRKKWANERAVNYLIECSGKNFDEALVHTFIQLIAIYPNGSTVKLSNGCYGIVKEQNKNLPMRPIVRVYTDKNGTEVETYEIDMQNELAITIVESEVELNEEATLF